MRLSSDVTIRTLGHDDVDAVDALRALATVFAEAFEDRDTYLGAQPAGAYLAELLGERTFIALVATTDDEIVGGIVAYELRKFEQERSEIYLYDLAVAQAYRRRGIATALIRELASIAEQRGAWVVFVQADLGDEPAMALYATVGEREDVVHFDIAVPWREDASGPSTKEHP